MTQDTANGVSSVVVRSNVNGVVVRLNGTREEVMQARLRNEVRLASSLRCFLLGMDTDCGEFGM